MVKERKNCHFIDNYLWLAVKDVLYVPHHSHVANNVHLSVSNCAGHLQYIINYNQCICKLTGFWCFPGPKTIQPSCWRWHSSSVLTPAATLTLEMPNLQFYRSCSSSIHCNKRERIIIQSNRVCGHGHTSAIFTMFIPRNVFLTRMVLIIK